MVSSMTRLYRNIFGSDGYKELEVKEKAAKGTRKNTNSPIVKKRREKEKEVLKLRTAHSKRKVRNPRASKLIVPKGTGKRNIGESR